MKVIQRIDHHQLKTQWELVNKAFNVSQHTENDKVRAACTLIGCHFHGAKWCKENGHTWIPIDKLDFQIVNEEETRLKQKGLI